VSPEVVRAEAIAWYAETGDPGALHCEAIALSEIGALRSAAAKMQTVAQLPDIDTLTRVDLLTQAALLWRQDGSSDAAFGALDTALKYQRTPRVLIERSILHAERRAWEEAKADLDEALRMAPGDDEALALRAAANRRLGDHRAALQDAEQAIAVRPVSAAGWFELGKAELALGRKNGARRAWLKAIDVSPGGPYAALARGQLQDMDGGG
ncbi:MAG: tetratricopeptide repeat protein, partial [Pseudomonadota bacterium]